jgi:hypothetical protein
MGKSTLESTPGAEPNPDPFHSNSSSNSLHYLESKLRPVLDGTAILVRSVIAYVLDELVGQVTIGTINRNEC